MEERRQAVEWFRAMGMKVETRANNQEESEIKVEQPKERGDEAGNAV
jgi:hypothetical protein